MKEIYEKILSEIPDYEVFMTVDELEESSRRLAERHSDIAEVFCIGKTKLGRDIPCLRIGRGKHTGLMFGCPHPNEPIGTMTMEYFTRKLAENRELLNELDYTWYFVKAWDSDGLKMNEGWLKGPYTIYNYSRNFMRPAGHRQVDWTFPVDYKEMHFHGELPETTAMMRLIDRIRPEFIYSLHNAGFGGAYWYITEGDQELYDGFYEAARRYGVPIHMGEAETPSCVPLAPAVYALLSIRDEYDYIEKYGDGTDMSAVIECGDTSSAYAGERYGTLSFLTELPYFYDKRVDDTSESDMVRRDAALMNLDYTRKANTELRGIMNVSKEYLDPEDPYILAVESFTRDDMDGATRRMIADNPEYSRKATVAEKFDSLYVNRFYKLLQYGMLIRANEDELARMEERGETDEEKRSALRVAFDLAVGAHRREAAFLEENMNYQVVPIKKLIGVQLECGLKVAEYVKTKR